jgi:transcriptional regulator with XRE-family HTH domain
MAVLKAKFGRRLMQVRRAQGLTQEQLAAKTELTIETISNIERGVHAPRFNTLEKIADSLELHVKELFRF